MDIQRPGPNPDDEHEVLDPPAAALNTCTVASPTRYPHRCAHLASGRKNRIRQH